LSSWYSPARKRPPGVSVPGPSVPFYGGIFHNPKVGPYAGGTAPSLVRPFASTAANPNYGGLIGAQPDLSALQAQFKADSIADAAARDAAIRRYVVSYGQIPDFSKLGISGAAAGFLSNAINDNIRNLAAQNELEGTSIHARMNKEANQAMARIPAVLASRGILRSGQTGVDLANQAQASKNIQFDTLNELLGNIENVTSSFLNAERDRANQMAMAEMQAAWAAANGLGGNVPVGQQQGSGSPWLYGGHTPALVRPPNWVLGR
jgi:hypothetical protein